MKVFSGVFGVGKGSSCPCSGNNQALKEKVTMKAVEGCENVLMMSIDSSQSRKSVVC